MSPVRLCRLGLSSAPPDRLDEARGVPSVSAEGLDSVVLAVDEVRDFEVQTQLLGDIQSKSQILAHPVDRETKVVMSIGDGFTAVIHLPRLRRTPLDGLGNSLDIQACAFGKMVGLCESPQHASNTELVDHFG